MGAVTDVGIPVWIGVVISWWLSGVSIGQGIFYYRSYREDRLVLKILVALALSLDIAHAICLIDFIWRSFILAHNNVEQSLSLPVSLTTSIAMSYVITFVVQSFYAYRVWRMSNKNKPVTFTIFFLACVQFVSGVGLATAIILGKVVNGLHTDAVQHWASVENSSTVACDFLITGSLVYYLNDKRTGFRKTENIINRLIFYSVNMGLMTSAVVGLELIFYLAFWKTWTFFIFHFPISKCYVNSLLALLNTRNAVRNIGSQPGTLSVSGAQEV